jgi:hypothetical protein
MALWWPCCFGFLIPCLILHQLTIAYQHQEHGPPKDVDKNKDAYNGGRYNSETHDKERLPTGS